MFFYWIWDSGRSTNIGVQSGVSRVDHQRPNRDYDDDDDDDDNKGLNEDEAAGNEELVAHGWADATSKNKTKKTAGKKDVKRVRVILNVQKRIRIGLSRKIITDS